MKELIKVEVLNTTTESKRNHYKISINYNNESFTVVFHDSIYSYKNGISLNTDDVIYSILMDAMAYDNCDGLEDFASEYGYDLYDELEEGYDPTLLDAYTECHRISDALKRMFTSSELEELEKEFAEY
jgi:hypothetical protein